MKEHEKNPETFEVTELEDKALEEVAGGAEAEAIGVDISCTDNKDCPNSGNCVSGCSCT